MMSLVTVVWLLSSSCLCICRYHIRHDIRVTLSSGLLACHAQCDASVNMLQCYHHLQLVVHLDILLAWACV